MPPISLGQYIQQLRLAADLSKRELGIKVSVSPAHIGDIEQGFRQPSEELMARIAEVLGVSLADLQNHSTRPPAKEMEALIKENNEYSLAFRNFVNVVREKNITPETISNIVSKLRKP